MRLSATCSLLRPNNPHSLSSTHAPGRQDETTSEFWDAAPLFQN
uniref:Uncharacterized protein n=1 Tax=viral metagenome TaxID=1070528 RepID=A0A6C0BZH0_9ZZZZ